MRTIMGTPATSNAESLVLGDRQEAYGDPLVNYERLAELMSTLLGFDVSRRQAITTMILVKLCRDASHPKEDNEVDICGYALILQMDREAVESLEIKATRP